MFFTNKWRRKVINLSDELRSIKQDVAKLNCEAGRHEWVVTGADKANPRFPPYLRCNFCWVKPE